jgi:hypothetical protein
MRAVTFQLTIKILHPSLKKMKRWLTNLENPEAVDKHSPEKLAGAARDLEAIRRKHGDVVIGPPVGTDELTAEQITDNGYYGVYLPGTSVVG